VTADPFRVRCPHCRRLYHLRLDAEKLGRLRQKAFCGRCKRRFSLSPRVIERRTVPPPSIPPDPDTDRSGDPPAAAGDGGVDESGRVSTVGMETWASLLAGVQPVREQDRPQTPPPVGGDDGPETAIDDEDSPAEVAAAVVHADPAVISVASEEEIADERDVLSEEEDEEGEVATVAPPPLPVEEQHEEASGEERPTLVHGDIEAAGLMPDTAAEPAAEPAERSGELATGDRPSRTRGRTSVVMTRDDWIAYADPGLLGIVAKAMTGAEALGRLLG
jgi:hypothetical protein